MRRKMTQLAQALVLVDSLSPEEQQTLSDYLKGKLPARPKSFTVQAAGRRLSRKNTGDVTEPHKTSGVAVGGSNENPSPVGITASGD